VTLDCTCQENSAAVGAEQYSFFGGFDDGELELDGGLEVLANRSTRPLPHHMHAEERHWVAQSTRRNQQTRCSDRSAHTLRTVQDGVEAPPEEERVDPDLGGDGDLSFAAMFAAQAALGPEDEQVEAPKPLQQASDISPWPSAVFSLPQPASIPQPTLPEVRLAVEAACGGGPDDWLLG